MSQKYLKQLINLAIGMKAAFISFLLSRNVDAMHDWKQKGGKAKRTNRGNASLSDID